MKGGLILGVIKVLKKRRGYLRGAIRGGGGYMGELIRREIRYLSSTFTLSFLFSEASSEIRYLALRPMRSFWKRKLINTISQEILV